MPCGARRSCACAGPGPIPEPSPCAGPRNEETVVERDDSDSLGRRGFGKARPGTRTDGFAEERSRYDAGREMVTAPPHPGTHAERERIAEPRGPTEFGIRRAKRRRC